MALNVCIHNRLDNEREIRARARNHLPPAQAIITIAKKNKEVNNNKNNNNNDNNSKRERTCLESLFLSFDFRRLSNNLPSNKRRSNLNSIHTNTCTEVYC